MALLRAHSPHSACGYCTLILKKQAAASDSGILRENKTVEIKLLPYIVNVLLYNVPPKSWEF
jgi:hypothetical protein